MDYIIREYNNDDFEEVYETVHNTIDRVYPEYYPRDIVTFFHNFHSRKKMLDSLHHEKTLIIEKNKRIISTGSFTENEIRRMFIRPEEQSKGYGRILLKNLEKIALDEGCKELELSSTLGAYRFYQKCGYAKKEYIIYDVGNKAKLCYFQMRKSISKNSGHTINYNSRKFKPVVNTENGEVNDDTVFCYYQENNIIWADYSGGTIVKGFLTGTSDSDGKLNFNYLHSSMDGLIKTGRCTSIPEVLPDGRIRLHEKWAWTCGDFSEGESVIEEI